MRAPGVLPVAFPTSFRWIGRKHSVALHCRKTSRRPPPPWLPGVGGNRKVRRSTVEIRPGTYWVDRELAGRTGLRCRVSSSTGTGAKYSF